MKKTRILLTSLLMTMFTLLIVSVVYSQTSYLAGNEKTSISVPSIVCGKCVKNITKALKNVDGVIKVKVDLDSKIATVTYDTEKTSVSNLENAITAAGYDANNKTADPTAYEKLDDCCKIR